MNERIQELKQQAEAYVDSADNDLGIEQYRELVDQKFAELIIKECMGCCGQVAEDAHKQKSSSFLTQDGKQLYNGVWGGAMNCGSAIANHFGVEE
jgi:hypothetical protein